MNKLNVEVLKKQFPLVEQLINLDEVCWFNPNVTSLEEGLPHVGLNAEDIHVAECKAQALCSLSYESFS